MIRPHHRITRVAPAAFTIASAIGLAASPFPTLAQTLTLGAAADSTLARHPSILAAEARVDGAESASRAVRAAYLPSVVSAGGLTRYQEPMVVAPLHGFDPRNPPAFDRTLVQGQIVLEYTLFDGGARGAQVRGADAAEEGLALRRDATAQELLEAVAAAYTGILATRELRTAAERQVEALASEEDRANQRLREGTAARVEVLRAEAALLDARAQLASAAARVGLAERSLARLMGADPSALAARELEDIVPRASASGSSADAAAVEPRIEAARRNVDAARSRLRQERAGRLPTLRGSAGLLDFGSSSGDYVTEWQAGIRVTWPLFTGGARTAAIRRAEADVRVAEEELRQAELAVAASLDGAETALTDATARARALEASVAQWEEVARIEALSLEAGSGVQQDYLRAEAALFQARAGWARARYDEILALVGRARARGTLDRGWMDTELEARR